ncbi:MAG: type II CRISPR RNA-guided endonuclease Cas9 [Elusimicrobia bacterium]|nr:type II CRISPR RNA-guided endonuclease Cas9 [Elusimicrobiota bacterium]MDE2236554.1 type II CRISPR RNA-guided endonuclease Cas9 [Elusimicrobiota bacterium]MDE2425559.1 type II CRISPR RNA-guided endonuclease Cas9 [Elusimicrobiota bacterium]
MGKESEVVLGLDIGTNSLGWALVKGEREILGMGVRVFKAGSEGDISSGKDEPLNAERRAKRQIRRQLWRRARRLEVVFNALKRAKLIPTDAQSDAQGRHEALEKLDDEFRAKHLPPGDHRAAQLLPYILRDKALNGALEPFAIGRALYHLAQRRGFQSNRKSAQKKDEELGQVKSSIATLDQSIKNSGARTLGEYFSGLDPEKDKLRRRWTARQMLADEFGAIWCAQARHHPALLTESAKKSICKAIFRQRPLKSQKHLIGKCPFETDRPRSAIALLETQRFRLLQKVNDLRLIMPEGEIGLSTDKRKNVIDALEREGDMTFAKLRKLLGLPKNAAFNLQRGEETRLPGNRTAAKIRAAIGERWDAMTAEERARLVEDMRSIQSESAFVKRMAGHWGFATEKVQALSDTVLEDGYGALSLRAVRKLLPELEGGMQYATAVKRVYPGRSGTPKPVDILPLPPKLRNPVVEKSVAQVRRVVNALVAKHGKPDVIRVELARDLKTPRKIREERSKRMRAQQKEREKASQKIVIDTGIKSPSRGDIEKYLLALECDFTCPYTNKRFSISDLFGGQVDVEHIIPFHRSLDDSFSNKTLCEANENRQVKKGKTPFEAYSNTPKWAGILERVKRFKGNAGKEKLRRFEMDTEEVMERFETFASRQLNDTRYASREAGTYLGALFGCRADQPGVDGEGKRRVSAGAGQVTATLRAEWGLNKLLNTENIKSRDDHRHHAVDALVVALSNPARVKNLSDAAAGAAAAKRRRYAPLEAPWNGFLDDARKAVSSVIVSPAVSRKVSGALHEETLYSPLKKDESGRPCVHVRKELGDQFKAVDDIVDPAVREAVKAHLLARGNDPKKAFSDPADLPHLKSGTPIKRVRIRVHQSATPISKGYRERFVMTGANHHMEVFEKDGKWDAEVVTLFEAHRRLRANESIIRRDHGEGTKYVFTLHNGEVLELDQAEGKRGLFVIRSLNTLLQNARCYPRVEMTSLTDARLGKDIKKTKRWGTYLLNPLRKLQPKKFVVSPTGELIPSRE